MLLSVFLFTLGLFAPSFSLEQVLAGPVVGGAPVCAEYEPPRIPMVQYRVAESMIDVDMAYIENPVVMFAGHKLKANAYECETRFPRGRFDDLQQMMLDEHVYIERHTFRAFGDVARPATYSLFAIPNFVGYADLKEAQKDFKNCNEIPEFQPIQVTPSTILFERPCVQSAKDDRVSGCARAKAAVDGITLR